jgi:ribonuclease HII
MSSERTAKNNLITLEFERKVWVGGKTLVAGVDEAGRGSLAGPVVAAAVIFQPECLIPAVNDSKLLAENTRDILYAEIKNKALAVGVGIVDHVTIDEINILNATYKAMHDAIANLNIVPEHLLIDGNRFRGGTIPFTTIVAGDALCFSIAAASIVAKVTRDRVMADHDAKYPGYGFAKHKGYGTKEHREAIYQLGYCEIHRRSFQMNTQLELEF